MRKLKPIRAKRVIMGIGIAVIAFDTLAFAIDFYRPPSRLSVAKQFPYRILPSPSLKYLDSADQDDASIQDASSEDRSKDLKTNASVTDEDRTDGVDHESRLLSVAKAIEAGDVDANRLTRDPSSRDAILSSARMIRNYRAGSPTGHLPDYLEYQIDRVKANQRIDRISPERIRSWNLSYGNTIGDEARKTGNEANASSAPVNEGDQSANPPEMPTGR